MGKAIQFENRISIAEASRELFMSEEDFKESLAQGFYPSYVGHAYIKPGNKNRTFIVYKSGIKRLKEEYFGGV